MRRLPSIPRPALGSPTTFRKSIHHQLRQQIKVLSLVLGDVRRAEHRRRERIVREEDKVFDRLERPALELGTLFLHDRNHQRPRGRTIGLGYARILCAPCASSNRRAAHSQTHGPARHWHVSRYSRRKSTHRENQHTSSHPKTATTNLDHQRPDGLYTPKHILNRQRPILRRQTFPTRRCYACVHGPRMRLERRQGNTMDM
jgi:hypothetical protein